MAVANQTVERAQRKPTRYYVGLALRYALLIAIGVVLFTPFILAGIGSGFDGERPFTGLVLVHADAAAEENATRLVARIREGATQGRTENGAYMDTPWMDLIDRVDLLVEGRFLAARLYFSAPGIGQLLGFGDQSLIVHE